MANKFLGLDSINVLKQYIDEQIIAVNVDSRITTIQAYTYVKDSDPRPVTPEPSTDGGDFDSVGMTFVYPTGWDSLAGVIRGIEEGRYDSDITDVDIALSVGSIWMSVGVLSGSDSIPDEYSKPVKISGQNGISVRYMFSYNPDAPETDRYENPKGPTAENVVEYVWTKVGDNDWQGPSIWAMYAESGTDIKMIFKVTNTVDDDYNVVVPSTPGASNDWSNSIGSLSISKDYPYLWMSCKKVVAGDNGNGIPWSTPVMIGRWGEDGAVPDYTYTMYCKGTDSVDYPTLPGVVAPLQPEFVEKQPVSFYLKDGWQILPEDDDSIWWQCTLMVDGHKSIVTEIGGVKRYNAIDGTSKPGSYIKYLYHWQPNQSTPEIELDVDGDIVYNEDSWTPKGWYEIPDYDKKDDWENDVDSIKPDASLWVISAAADGLTADGHPNVAEWSSPYKISGPVGPIAYDYRIETRYMEGTEDTPHQSSDDYPWYEKIDDLQLDSKFQYIWAKDYLVYYIMKYADYPNADGTYPIVQATNSPTFVTDENGKYITRGEYRLSGLNGTDGNKKNTLSYSNIETPTEIEVNSFMTNLYVSNSSADVTYQITFDEFYFINGYTGKFANIGTGKVTINGTNVTFIGSCKSATTIELDPQECVELVCCKNSDGGDKQLLVIGKAL